VNLLASRPVVVDYPVVEGSRGHGLLSVTSLETSADILGIAKGEHGLANRCEEKQADSETRSLAESLSYFQANHDVKNDPDQRDDSHNSPPVWFPSNFRQ